MKICVLSAGEVACYVEYGDLPRCSDNRHHHISVEDAVEGVRLDKYRFVCPCRGRCVCNNTRNFAVTEQSSNFYKWKKVPSAGYPVQQMVRARKKKPHVQVYTEARNTLAAQ